MSADLKEALSVVESALCSAEAGVGPFSHGDRDWWSRHRAAMEQCAAQLTARLGARINDRWNGCSVRIAGLSSTSTSGMAGALRNWMAAAERRIRDAAAAGRAG